MYTPFLTDLIYNMDHMRISSVIIRMTYMYEFPNL